VSDPLECRQCGAPLQDDAQFCTACGKATKGSSTKRWVILGIGLAVLFFIVASAYSQSQLKHSTEPIHAAVAWHRLGR
jgi:predicted amidophosphoribosyltransferase